MLAQWCAIPKFAIIGLGLAYFFVGGAIVLIMKARATPSDKSDGCQSESPQSGLVAQ